MGTQWIHLILGTRWIHLIFWIPEANLITAHLRPSWSPQSTCQKIIQLVSVRNHLSVQDQCDIPAIPDAGSNRSTRFTNNLDLLDQQKFLRLTVAMSCWFPYSRNVLIFGFSSQQHQSLKLHTLSFFFRLILRLVAVDRNLYFIADSPRHSQRGHFHK